MPHLELERVQIVNRFLKLEFNKNHELQELVQLAARVCGTETALITFIDHDTQYIKFKKNFAFDSTSRDAAFCNHVIENNALLVIPDARIDERFEGNPLVVGDPNIRFYAGAPLTTSEGDNLGSLCVIDRSPSHLTDLQKEILTALAKQAMHLMEFDNSLNAVKDLYLEAKRSEIELRSFFESSIDQHLLLGRNFEILAFNKSWETHVLKMYGLQMEKGKVMIDYINPDHLRRFYIDYSTALKGTAVYDERNLKQNGKDRWHVVKFEPAFNPDGDIIGVSVNVSDVNTKVEHQNTVRSQNEQLDEIAFIQTHEFRRPVASIIALVDLLRMDDRVKDLEEWEMLSLAIKELDDKVKLIVQNISGDKR
jgi:PAS domain S-box-containing protein